MDRSIVVRRAALAAACGTLTTLVLGCMSLSIGGRNGSVISEDGSADGGKVMVPANEEMVVYYPVPFASPPNLTLESTWNDYVLVEQLPDRFKIKNPNSSTREVTWKARGVHPATVVAVPVPTVPTSSASVANTP